VTPRRVSAALAWPAVTLASLLVGVIALTSAPARIGQGPPASRLLLDLPEVLVALAVASGALAVILVMAFGLALARKKGKDKDARLALWGMVLLPLVMAAVALWHDGSLERLLSGWHGAQTPPAGPEADPGAEPPTASEPLFTAAVGTLVLGAGLASLAAVGWMLFGGRLTERWSARAQDPLAGAVEDSLDDLRLEPDARRAIVRCYRRFESVLARSRFPRAPWQTPLEFMREALGRLPLPADAVRRLTELFEVARFSEEPLTSADRDAAWEALLRIRASLESGARPERQERDVAAG